MRNIEIMIIAPLLPPFIADANSLIKEEIAFSGCGLL